MRRQVAIASALLGILTTGRAAAYVVYRTDEGKPFYWRESCTTLTAYPDNFHELPAGEVRQAIIASVDAWTPPARSCSYFEVALHIAPGSSPRAAYDASNNLMFVTRDWCRFNQKDNRCDRDDLALALTSLYAKGDGHIVDADIEVNAAMDRIKWMNADTGATVGLHDLQNTLTHEMGHFMGFNHTCYMPGERRPRGIDNTGMPVIDCAASSDLVKLTTMYPDTDPGETGKRMLEEDDILAVCETYTPALDPKICRASALPDTCGCALRASPPRLPAALLTLGLGLTALWFRRRPR